MKHSLSLAICVIVSLVLFSVGTRYLRDVWIFSTLHSLQLHLALACAAASLVAWLLQRGPIAPGLLIVSLLLFAHALWMGREFHHPVAPADHDAPAISILSFNI